MNNKIVSGVFWSFGERIIAQMVSFIVSIILARLLTPDDYGIIAILLIFINFADIFVSNGLGTALIQNKDADYDDFSTIFYCSFVISMITYLAIYILSPFIAEFYENDAITIMMRILAIRIPISAYNNVQKAFISRHMIFKKFFFTTLVGTTISAVLGVIMAYLGAGAWALIAQYLSNAIIDSVTLTFIVEWKPKLVFKIDRAKKMLSFGWKVLCAEVIGTLFDQLQSLTIGKAFSPADLAFYHKGNQIPSMISGNIGNSVMTVLFPAIANYGEDYAAIKRMTRKSIRMMIYIIFPIMFGLAMVARPLILLLLTDKWSSSVQYMEILCFAVAFSLVGGTSLQTIKALGRSDLLLKIELIKKPVFIIMLICGIKFGVIGVAVSSCIYSFFAMIINFGTVGKIISYSFLEQWTDIIEVSKISVIMCGVVLLLNLLNISSDLVELLIKSFVGMTSYIIISKLTKSDEYAYLLGFIKNKCRHSF